MKTAITQPLSCFYSHQLSANLVISSFCGGTILVSGTKHEKVGLVSHVLIDHSDVEASSTTRSRNKHVNLTAEYVSIGSNERV